MEDKEKTLAHLIRGDGTMAVVEPAKGRTFTLQEIYALLRCDRVQVIVLPIPPALLLRPIGQDGLLLVDPGEIA